MKNHSGLVSRHPQSRRSRFSQQSEIVMLEIKAICLLRAVSAGLRETKQKQQQQKSLCWLIKVKIGPMTALENDFCHFMKRGNVGGGAPSLQVSATAATRTNLPC